MNAGLDCPIENWYVSEVEEFVRQYGEEYRLLIADALDWLNKREPCWKLKKPIGRKSFIKGLVRKAKKVNKN